MKKKPKKWLGQIDLLKKHYKNNHHLNNSHKWTAFRKLFTREIRTPAYRHVAHDQRERRIPRNPKPKGLSIKKKKKNCPKGQNGDVSKIPFAH
jgi:hypothetical protein